MCSDTPSSLGKPLRHQVAMATNSVIITFGRRRYGSPWAVARMVSFIVRMECSTSGTCSSGPQISRETFPKDSRRHSNSLSACTSTTSKPRAEYSSMLLLTKDNIVSLVRSETATACLYPTFRDMAWIKGSRWTKKIETKSNIGMMFGNVPRERGK